MRKKAKGFGRNALIEGDVPEGRRTLLVEDLTTDGQSKIRFAQALRDAGAIVNHAFVVFFYGVFPGAFETLARMDIALHHLCTWWDVLEACKDRPYFAEPALAEVRRFLEDPVAWSAAHRQFHDALIVGCGSPWTLRLCRLLFDQSERYRALSVQPARKKKRDVGSEHRELADAALARDADALCTLIDSHFRTTAHLILEGGLGDGGARSAKAARRSNGA